jgi:hypothetical protein
MACGATDITARKLQLPRQFKLIWVVQSYGEKYSASHPPQIKGSLALSRPTEGRLAIVMNAGRDAVDARALPDERHSSGRQSRVVLAPRRWCQVRGTQVPWATVANKPGTPGRVRNKP